jgi:hypothetical protein
MATLTVPWTLVLPAALLPKCDEVDGRSGMAEAANFGQTGNGLESEGCSLVVAAED